MNVKECNEELDRRRAIASQMGGLEKLKKRKERGVLNAQERLDALIDPGSFIESGLLGVSSMFKEDESKTPRDGKITGFAKIDGRDVGIVVYDFTTKGATTSPTSGKKMGHIRSTATKKGFPFIHIGESSGARLPDAQGSRGMGTMLGTDPAQFLRTRETPWAASLMDTCFGSSAWNACLADFSVMRKKDTIMSVSSPRLVSMAIGEKISADELGGWRLHADITGLVDRFVDTDEQVLQEIRKFLSYMPSHNGELPPEITPAEDAAQDQTKILDVFPDNRTQVYDMRKIISIFADKGSVFEFRARFGKPAIVALARLKGKVIGILANNPLFGGGALSAEAIRKLIDFQVMCDSFNIPIIRFMDTPGFVVGTDAERKGAPGWIMNFMSSTSQITVPNITILCRKGYGRAYVAMGGGRNNEEMIAWPTAEISFMDPAYATKIVHNISPGEEGFEEAFAHIKKSNEIWEMAKIYAVASVVKPQETREYVSRMLNIYQSRKTKGIGEHLMKGWPTSY